MNIKQTDANSTNRILLSGDYWHDDFRNVVSQIDCPTILVPPSQLDSVEPSVDAPTLIVLAQSRRAQFSQGDVGALQAKFGMIPIVVLSGSWCEGQQRSGDALKGVVNLFWHQWTGQYELFCRQVAEHGAGSWHLPKTANQLDRMERERQLSLDTPSDDELQPTQDRLVIGICAWTPSEFEMLADTFRSFGWDTFWMLRHDWDGDSRSICDVICVDANSLSPDVTDLLSEMRKRHPTTPMILVLNFPRAFDVETAADLGIREIVSKPFHLANLRFAVERAVSESVDSGTTH